ncbi:MAG TPA: amidohydrolase [Thermoplasmata archaeon]|nr:amidohydrolase [Thermoplasmata archaeon]
MTDATLFVGGRVYTGGRYAEALLVEGGRVAAVGSEEEARRTAATGADRVDLAGGLVVPGLADAHLHLGDLTRAEQMFDAATTPSIPELVRRLSAWAHTHPGVAVVGGGLDPGRLAERRWPMVEELDAAVRDRPVVLYHPSGHAALVNSAALDRGPVPSSSSPVPRVPRGVLVEEQLEALGPWVEEAVPLTLDAVEATAHRLVRLGITAVGTMSTGADELALLQQLDEGGRLPIQVRAYPVLADGIPDARLSGANGGRRCTVVGVKVFLDGAFGPRTASLDEPYADDPSTRGVDRGDDAVLEVALEEARAAGLAPALHAIGDRAVGRAVRLLSKTRPGNPPARIEHASLVPPALFGPLRRVGASLVVQPGFLLSDVWLQERLGVPRARWAYPFRSLADRSVPLAGSSDAPYDRLDPWPAMRAAVRRRDDLGRSANPSPDEAVSETEAFALFAQAASQALGDRERGRLEVGAPADLVVLGVPRLGDAIRSGAAAVRATWVAGRPVRPDRSPEESV